MAKGSPGFEWRVTHKSNFIPPLGFIDTATVILRILIKYTRKIFNVHTIYIVQFYESVNFEIFFSNLQRVWNNLIFHIEVSEYFNFYIS